MQFESLEQAVQFRKMFELQTESLPDEKAVRVANFVQRWKPGVVYGVGDRVGADKDGEVVLFKCLQSHASQDIWHPTDAPSLWTKILIPDPDVIPVWEQPESTNPYSIGDKVVHEEKTWQSELDGNVWEPGVHGWIEI